MPVTPEDRLRTAYLDAPFVALAHRGFSLDGLENSMVAFQNAVDLGFRYVETDAHGTADGVAVALHDASLDRTTDASGAVADLDWETVRRARIGGREPVPSLEELLGTWPDLRVNIDVKADSAVEPTARAVERTRAHDRVCITSFALRRRLRTLALLTAPVATSAARGEVTGFLIDTRLGLDYAARRALRRVDLLQVPEKQGPVTVVDRATLRQAHRQGVGVHVWTVDDPADMTRLIDLGVDGLVTNRADLLAAVLAERGIPL